MGIKVAHAILGFAPQIGGAENQAKLLCEKLVGNVESVDIFTRRYGWVANPNLSPKLRVRRYWLAAGFASKEIASMCIAISLCLRGSQYSIFHVHQCNMLAALVCIVGWLWRKPVIIKVANSGDKFDLKILRDRPYGKLVLPIVRSGGAIFVALTQKIKSELVREGISEEKIHLIPNGIKLPSRSEIKPKSGDKITVGVIGRLEPVKNPFLVLKVAEMLPDFEFRFIGDGRLKRELEDEVWRRGLSNVSFRGLLAEPSDIYRELNVVLHPSNAEGMSNVLLESTGRALPVVVADIEANLLAYQGFESCAEFVSSGDAGAWAEALQRSVYKFSASGFLTDVSKFRAFYDINIVCRKYVDLYLALIADDVRR